MVGWFEAQWHVEPNSNVRASHYQKPTWIATCNGFHAVDFRSTGFCGTQIDTALLYENHRDIGQALAAGTVPRDEVTHRFDQHPMLISFIPPTGVHRHQNSSYWDGSESKWPACIAPRDLSLSYDYCWQRHRWNLCCCPESSGGAWNSSWLSAPLSFFNQQEEIVPGAKSMNKHEKADTMILIG